MVHVLGTPHVPFVSMSLLERDLHCIHEPTYPAKVSLQYCVHS